MSLEVVYSREAISLYRLKWPVIFLAGPSPRSKEVPSWRPEAIRYLEVLGFDGIVLNPESREGHNEWGTLSDNSFKRQVRWELNGLHKADCVMFWIPRNEETLPGFTTNVEFGMMMEFDEEAVVAGAPPQAPHTRYLQRLAMLHDISWFDTLEETVKKAKEHAEIRAKERYFDFIEIA